MKRGWKIFWIVCAVCMGAGIVCCAISFTLGVTIEAIEKRFPDGFGFVTKSEDVYEDVEDYDVEDYDAGDIIEGSKRLRFNNAGSLDVDVWAGQIDVKTDTSLSDEIVIETTNISERLGLKCYMDGNELKVVSRRKVLRVNNGKAGKIVICIPAGIQFSEASVGLSAGYLHIGDISADELSVDVGAGEGSVDSFRAYEAELNCGAGSLIAAGSAEKQVDIECGVGEIIYTAQGKESDYNYNIDCGVGEIVCGENTYSGLGRSKTIDHHGSREMDIECGIGSVAVNFSER